MNNDISTHVEEFFQTTDWTLFYQSKMALCELIDHFCDSENQKEKNAVEWIESILNLMDGLGDIAEEMGLFVYPERDDDDDCLDDRFNHVLDKLPESEPSPQPNPVDAEAAKPAENAEATHSTDVLVTLRRIRLEDAFHPEVYEDDFIIEMPKEIREEEQAKYAEGVFRNMAHDMLTGPNAVSHILCSAMDFNWGDFIMHMDDTVKEKYRCHSPAAGTAVIGRRITLDVSQDEILLNYAEPCTVTSNGKEYDAEADMLTGAVTLHKPDETEAYYDGKAIVLPESDFVYCDGATITFLTGGCATLPLARSQEETKRNCDSQSNVYYWLAD